jgi:DNA polymerase-3 subunit epsilon
VIDLPDGVGRWEAFVSWPADGGTELDVLALVVDDDHRVLSDEHLAFFNNPVTPRGEVELTVDTAGEARAVLDLDELAGAGGRVVLAATTTDGTRFGDVGPVELLLTDSGGAPVARGVCDAATTEQSLLVAEVYRRGERWRIRSVGQGYDDGMTELAVRYGVDVG